MSDNLPLPPLNPAPVKTTLFTPSLYGGRFTRKQYFLYMLVGGIIFMILSRLLAVCMISLVSSIEFDSIEYVMQAHLLSSLIVEVSAAIFFFIPVAVKREHDIGYKGTFTITLFVIWLIVQFLLYYAAFHVSIENYENFIILYTTWGITTLIYGCFLLFKDSQKGSNAYGTSAEYRDTQSEVVETSWLKPSLFGGRFTRKQFFWRMLLVSIIVVIVNIILQQILVTSPTPKIGDFMLGTSSLERYQQQLMQVGLLTSIPAMILFYLPFGIKRAHDIGHKGTFLIALMVISLILQLLGCVSMEIYTNLSIILFIPSLIYGCILLFKDSERGTNAYGTSTKYPNSGLPKLFAGKSLASGKNRHCVKKVNVNDSAVGRPRLQKSKVEVPASGSVSLNQLKVNDK